MEPWLGRALALAVATGLVEMINGKTARLTQGRGEVTFQTIYYDESVFAEEKAFLSGVSRFATEGNIDKIMRMEALA
jgi:hypothetical protein